MSYMMIYSMPYPASGGTDPHFDSTKLLLGFEGADGATATSDESSAARGAATAFSNGAQIDTAQAKFGSSSLFLDGGDAHIRFGDSDDWHFTTTDDFTIEAWVRFNSTSGAQSICAQWDSSFESWSFQYGGSNTLQFVYWNGGAVTVAGAWTPSAGTWYHVAADKSGTTLRLYANGASIGSAAGIPSFTNPGLALRIGTVGGAAFSEANDFNGWIDELRITKGVARYASDSGYSVPTAAFPRS